MSRNDWRKAAPKSTVKSPRHLERRARRPVPKRVKEHFPLGRWKIDGWKALYPGFRQHVQFTPNKKQLRSGNGIPRYILRGWIPKKPFIQRSTKITAFGSCFAQEIINHLRRFGYGINNSKHLSEGLNLYFYGAGLVSTHALRQQFEWVYEGAHVEGQAWDYDKGTKVVADDKLRAATKKVFDETEVFILTCGISEIWYNTETGEPYWRKPVDPKGEKYGFKVANTSENVENLEAIYTILRKHRPDAHIIFTLSPVALKATFRKVGVITANCASKCILKAALDEFFRNHEGEEKLFYWPSYEIATVYFKDVFKNDLRHLEGGAVASIMKLFSRFYLA